MAAVVVPLTRFAVGVSLLSQPPRKSFGLGLLASMAGVPDDVRRVLGGDDEAV